MSEQGTPEWLEARRGKVTASRIKDIITRTKSGYSAARGKYRNELIAERLTGAPVIAYVNESMRWGTQNEPAARLAYESKTGNLVEEVGFVPHPTIPDAGASPDGLIEDDATLEIKCPNTTTHIETLLSGAVPEDHIPQIQWQLACTDRQFCVFVSYDPRMPEGMNLFVTAVERDDDMIDDITREVVKFLQEVEETINRLKGTF